MPRPELHHTLVAAVEAVSPQEGSGLVVTEVDLDLPLEIVVGERHGRPVAAGSAPHSRWVAGVLPQVSVGRLHVVEVSDG
jgi:hypothetical protein